MSLFAGLRMPVCDSGVWQKKAQGKMLPPSQTGVKRSCDAGKLKKITRSLSS